MNEAKTHNMTDWVTSDELIEGYPVLRSRAHVLRLVRRGVLPAHRLGARYVFDVDEVEEAIRQDRCGYDQGKNKHSEGGA